MRIEISDYNNEIILNAGVRYLDDRVLGIRLGELPDDELTALVLKLVEKKLQAMIADMRAPKAAAPPVEPEPAPGLPSALVLAPSVGAD
jgi:hypothetical protein